MVLCHQTDRTRKIDRVLRTMIGAQGANPLGIKAAQQGDIKDYVLVA